MLVQELKACDAVDLLVGDGWSFDEAHEITDFYIEEAIDNSESFLFDLVSIKYEWVSYENFTEAQIYYPMANDIKELSEFVKVIETKETILVSAV